MRGRRKRPNLSRRVELRQYPTTNIFGLPATGTGRGTRSAGFDAGTYRAVPMWAEFLGDESVSIDPHWLPSSISREQWEKAVLGADTVTRFRVRFVPALYADDPSRYALVETLGGGVWGSESFTAAYRVLKVQTDERRRYMVLTCQQVKAERLPGVAA